MSASLIPEGQLVLFVILAIDSKRMIDMVYPNPTKNLKASFMPTKDGLLVYNPPSTNYPPGMPFYSGNREVSRAAAVASATSTIKRSESLVNVGADQFSKH